MSVRIACWIIGIVSSGSNHRRTLFRARPVAPEHGELLPQHEELHDQARAWAYGGDKSTARPGSAEQLDRAQLHSESARAAARRQRTL
jgi:hypothetical protein